MKIDTYRKATKIQERIASLEDTISDIERNEISEITLDNGDKIYPGPTTEGFISKGVCQGLEAEIRQLKDTFESL